jgi:O-Antigen ligase
MLLVVISILPLFVMLFYRHPMLLLYAFPLVSLVEVFFPFYPFRLGRFSLLPFDPLYFLMVAYLGISALRYPRRVGSVLKDNIFLTLFLGIVAIYVVIYLPVHGQSAVGEARKFYGFFVFPLFASMVIKKPVHLHRLLQVVIIVAGLVAAVSLGVAAVRGSVVRVLNAEATLILALAAFAMFIQRMYRLKVIHPTADRILLCLFATLALASGQRSVWLAIGFGSILLLWLYRNLRAFMVKISVVAFAVLLTSGTALVYFPRVGERLADKFAGIVDPYSDKTASFRISGWRAQLGNVFEANPLFGEGLGGYYSWMKGRYEVKYSPHNAYVQIMVKFGLVGLMVYALVAFKFFQKMMAFRKKLGPGPMRARLETSILGFGAAHGYMLGYGFEPIMLIFLALGMSAAKLCQESFQTDRVLRERAVPNEPRIASERFPPRRVPDAVRS